MRHANHRSVLSTAQLIISRRVSTTPMVSSSCAFSVTVPKLSSVRRLPPSVPLTYQSFVHNPPICSVRATIGVNSKKFECRTKASAAEMATNKGKGEVKLFDSGEDLAVSLAKYIADLSDKFAKERGAFSIVFSGGSLFDSLSKLVEPPYINSVDWSKWHVFWVDERVVPKDHPDSNYLLAYDNFLSKVPILTGNVYAINDALSAEGAADDYETCLRHLVKNNTIAPSVASGFPKFDLVLLGMGPDGHVASLFPGHPLVKENEKWVTFIKDSPKPPPERITFTFPVINSSAHVALVIVGANQAHPVHVALGDGQNSGVLPVQMVSPEGELVWFLDKEAASKL